MESAANGLGTCSCDYVMVHDAARPLVSRDLLVDGRRRTTPCTAGRRGGQHRREGRRRRDREGLFTTQTPQSFLAKGWSPSRYGASVKDDKLSPGLRRAGA